MRVKFSSDILNTNLNNAVSYMDFFKALGYGRKEKIYFRFFSDRRQETKTPIREPKLYTLESRLSEFHDLNDQNRGVFFVVNGGGRRDTDVTQGRALFIDFDDFSFAEQLRRLNDFPFEPSIIIKTQKSLHCYWILEEHDRDILRWNELQFRMINHFGSDPSINNPSRVMRLYGFNHCKAEPVPVVLVKFDPDLVYTMRQFHEVLPRGLTEDQQRKLLNRMDERENGGGNRGKTYSANTKKITVPEDLSCSFKTIQRDECLRWLSRWARMHNVKCNACGVLFDGSVIYEMDCPWVNEHTTTEETGTPAAIIVFPDGKYGFHCFHGHCTGRGWKTFRGHFEEGDALNE